MYCIGAKLLKVKVKLKHLRPTQMTAGFREVAAKQKS